LSGGKSGKNLEFVLNRIVLIGLISLSLGVLLIGTDVGSAGKILLSIGAVMIMLGAIGLAFVV
jgi:hypothetical protein